MGRHERVAALTGADLGGLVVADLGCGPGRTVRSLLRAGPDRVHALDRVSDLDDDLLADPRVRSRITDLDLPLPFEGAALDRAVSLNVAEHLASPVAHLVECHRVLRPGGLLVLAHSDWDTALFTAADDALTRTLVDRFVAAAPPADSRPVHGPLVASTDAAGAPPPPPGRSDGFMGRKLLALADAAALAGADFTVREVDAWADVHRRFDDGSLAWKVATGMLAAAADDPDLAARAAGWVEDLRRLAAAEEFLFAVTDVAVVLERV